MFLIAWGIFTTYMFVASLRTNAAVGGWLGLATTAAAWYASFAAVVNSTFGRTVLSVRPLGN